MRSPRLLRFLYRDPAGRLPVDMVLMPPKSEKSSRTIELPAACVTARRSHQRRQAQERSLAGTGWQDTGHVFTSTIGTPSDDRKILKEFNALVGAAKLPKQRFHDRRHACISLLGAQRAPGTSSLKSSGISDIRLTQNVPSEAKTEAAAKMDALRTGLANAPAAVPENRVATKPAFEPVEISCKRLIRWSHPPGLNRRPADYEIPGLGLCC